MVNKGQCYVQWTNTSARVSGNSQVLLYDTTQTTMYFGWMITSTMTSTSGTIEFSVRWFETEGSGDDKRIIYSLSTQKAQCNIKQTMDLDLNTLAVEDMHELVYTRPIYAHIVNSMEGLSPRIIKQLATGEYNLEALDGWVDILYDLDEEDSSYDEDHAAKLIELQNKYSSNEYPNGIYVFEVKAESPDNLNITYQWFKGKNALAGDTEEGKGSKSAKYVATEPGTYHVEIGNGDATGYRYVYSPTVVVPAPKEIKYVNIAANKFFGFGSYSNNQTLSADVTADDSTAPNGVVHVDWYYAPMVVDGALVTDPAARNYSKISEQDLTVSGNDTYVTAEYSVPDKREGWYKCEATNNLNNAKSAKIVPEAVATVRAVPDQPSSVHIVYNADTRTITVDTISFPEGSPSASHPSEWHYQWSNGSDISAANGGNGFGDSYKVLNIQYPRENAEITYSVKVSHRVFNNNKIDSSAASGTAIQSESSVRASNPVTLKFTYAAGSDVPTITVTQA